MNKTAEDIAIEIYEIVGVAGGQPLCLACKRGRAILKVVEDALKQGEQKARQDHQIWGPMSLPTMSQIEDTKECVRQMQAREEWKDPSADAVFRDATINAGMAVAILKNPTAAQSGTTRPDDTYCEECDIYGHAEDSLVCYLWRNKVPNQGG